MTWHICASVDRMTVKGFVKQRPSRWLSCAKYVKYEAEHPVVFDGDWVVLRVADDTLVTSIVFESGSFEVMDMTVDMPVVHGGSTARISLPPPWTAP